jgi:NAD(P)-dependent dehydrogenase (short-subunit alcohol dehydrogenase family)
MKQLKGKVAVVTGAASGIGCGIAERCVAEGMKVVLADIEPEALSKTRAELEAKGAEVRSIQTDVCDPSDVERLAEKSIGYFGAVDLLCNNAGVRTDGSIWESTLNDWKWVMGVNLWGIIHGLRSFVPLMLEQNTEGHIVNTASIAGLLSPHPSASYIVSKHAVIALSEQLYHELSNRGAQIGVSVLCPSYVNTRIVDAARNRPAALSDDSNDAVDETLEAVRPALLEGMSPRRLSDHIFSAISEGRFWIRPHPEPEDGVRLHLEDILEGRNPRPSSSYPGVHSK